MKKGFTLIELLAVIVILAIVLVIAVPQVLKVIDQSRKDSLGASVKMYASALETDYLTSQTSTNPLVAPIATGATCPDVVDFNDGTCTYGLSITNGNPVATVTIVGSGKFAGYTGVGTKADVTVVNNNENDTTKPSVAFGINGNSTYAKSRSTTVTVSDGDSGVNTSSLKYLWTTSTESPTEESFSTAFTNGDSINTPTGVTGKYYLWILAKDNASNKTIIRSNVFNLDNIAPTIIINGSTPVTINVGDTYSDAGATATDNIDGNITENMDINSTINPSIVGTYTVTYTVSDTAGNTATPVVRTVNVIDNVAPSVVFGTNGNSTYAKSKNTTVTVSDNVSVITSSLKYQWTTNITEPTEASFSTSFTNGDSINTPSNATGGYYLWILAKDNASNTTIIRSDVFNLDNIAPTITMLGSSSVTINLGDTYSDAGATASDNIDGDITSNIIKTNTVNTSAGGTYTVTYSVSDAAGNSATTLTRTVNVNGIDISGPNYITSKGVNGPVLATGMVPIKWNGSAWSDTTVYDPNWYSYDTTNKQWANARTAEGSMWVWIPRYIYKITSGWHSGTTGTINIQFTKGTNDNWNSGVIGSISTDTTANASNNTWTNHPAFTFGGTELTGIWVAKFEATAAEGVQSSYSGCNLNDNVSTKTAKIVPNAVAWVCINNSNAFLASRNMETKSTYGWGTSGTGIDTHLMKNIEWGAVSYLTKSVYGKDTVEVWINNAKSLTTGCGASTVSGSQVTTCANTYETTNGVKASTTGNIYGIYDMRGGVDEQTAAYLNNNNANLTTYSSSLLSANAKYKDVYTVAGTDGAANNYALAIDHKGDAVYETSSNGTNSNGAWFSDYSLFSYTNSPSFYRGGNSNETTTAGLLDFKASSGNNANGVNGFRPVLLVGSGL